MLSLIDFRLIKNFLKTVVSMRAGPEPVRLRKKRTAFSNGSVAVTL
jgi:hypothetical protein